MEGYSLHGVMAEELHATSLYYKDPVVPPPLCQLEDGAALSTQQTG
jgi:hypothetical protein